MLILVMGVSGCGKSTVAHQLCEALNLPFIEADDFHPEANLLKMENGQPLNDNDREPWLQNLALELKKEEAKVEEKKAEEPAPAKEEAKPPA